VGDTLLIALVLVAALACPLAMWWQSRRGRPASCVVAPRNRAGEADDDVEGLRARHDELGARIARMESVQRSEAAGRPGNRGDRSAAPSSPDPAVHTFDNSDS